MKPANYLIRPENLPRIKELGYFRFVLFYAVIPTTVVFTVWIPAYKWLTTRGSLYSDAFDILDVLELARNVVLIAPLFGVTLGTVMWCAIVGGKPDQIKSPHRTKAKQIWLAVGFLFIGIVAGVSVGTQLGIWLHRTKMSPWEDSQIAQASAWYHFMSVRDLYLHGDFEAARKALLEHIGVLSQINVESLGYAGFASPRTEIARTYVRLSLLEQSEGNDLQAQDYWDEAVSIFEYAGWKEVDRRKVLLVLKVTDGALPDGIDIPQPEENQ